MPSVIDISRLGKLTSKAATIGVAVPKGIYTLILSIFQTVARGIRWFQKRKADPIKESKVKGPYDAVYMQYICTKMLYRLYSIQSL